MVSELRRYKMKTQLDMKEINCIPKNGYNIISLFSGCGGSSLGYKLAGYNVRCAVEFIDKAADTYKANFPNTPVLKKDVREISGEELLEFAGLKKYEVDILDGSPPCCDFSINGKREKGWGKVKNYSSTKQRVDDLFFEYARLVKDMMPKVFVAENTKGITLGKAKDVLKEVIRVLTDIGYNVDYRVLDASKYGVPQKRERTIIVGVRKDLNINPVFPKETGKIMTTKEAIGDLIDNGTDQVNHSKREKLIKKYFHAGCTSADIKKICAENNLKVYEQSFRRDKWNEPYYTIKQHHTRPYHPVVDRLMSIDEAKRIQTFPDDFKLLHSPTQNWERIGRAVPPTLMMEISKTIQTEILDKLEEDENER
jgi:DNA (cytosine-5)-methyltransferase 1